MCCLSTGRGGYGFRQALVRLLTSLFSAASLWQMSPVRISQVTRCCIPKPKPDIIRNAGRPKCLCHPPDTESAMVRALWLPAVLWCLVRCVAGTSACQADSEHSSALQTSLKDLRGHSHGHHGHHQAMDGSHSHLKTKKHKAAKRKARLQARRKRKQAKLAKSHLNHLNHSEPWHAAELLNEERQETEVARAVRKSAKAKKQHKKEKKVKKTHVS